MGTEAGASAFDNEQFDAIYPPGVERHYWNIARNAIVEDALRSAGPGAALEVGCGKGLVVAYLRDRGLDVTGVDLAPVDPVPEAAAHVRTGSDLFDIDPGLFSGVRTILLLDVIEHIEDPVSFIRRIRDHLPWVRTFIFTVPARQELFSNYDEFNRHFLRYDLPTLRRHTDPDGTRGWKASYFFHSLYPAAWLILRIKGARRTWYDVPETPWQRFVHRVLGGVFRLEHALLPSRLPGTSIIATVTEVK